MNKHYIIREVHEPDFSFYFDGDTFSERAGDYGYTIFPISYDHYRYYCGLNEDAYKAICSELESIIDDIESVINGYDYFKNIKDVMEYRGLHYSPAGAHALKGLIETGNHIDQLCSYLTIKTGKQWDSYGVSGYCQGNYVSMVYCKDFYNEQSVRVYGEVYLGCAKEFSITDIEDGDTCYGFIVADCEARDDADYLKAVCDMDRINIEDARLEMIDHIETIHRAVYREVA